MEMFRYFSQTGIARTVVSQAIRYSKTYKFI